MAHLSFGNIEVSARGAHSLAARPNSDLPFRILIVGDFSGRTNRRIVEPLDARRPAKVDCDNFDALLARLQPKLELPLGDGSAAAITFAKLDDFHPDALFARLPHFTKWQETRAGINNPATWREAAAAWSAVPAHGAAPVAAAPPAIAEESGADLLQSLLGGAPTAPRPAPPAGGSNLDALLRDMIAPHIVAGPEPAQAPMVAAVDAAIGEQMRALLHGPDFQALEAAWRALDFLVRNLDTDETLQLSVLDISKPELAADLAGDDLAASGTYRLLASETVHGADAESWAAIIGLHAFDLASGEDAMLLGRIGKIAAAAGAPFIASAVAASTPAEAWTTLRALPEAAYIALVAPRFLLRLPYGAQTDPIERFAFEEMPHGPEQAAYLWGNSAIVCASLLGRAFRENEWEMSPDDATELSGLPVHTFKNEHGETAATPCGERWLIDREAEALLRLGLMPILSIRGRDAVRLLRFQSIAEPPQALAGRWA